MFLFAIEHKTAWETCHGIKKLRQNSFGVECINRKHYMKTDLIKTFNQEILPMDQVSLDDIKGGSMSGSGLCCIANSHCNSNGAENPKEKQS